MAMLSRPKARSRATAEKKEAVSLPKIYKPSKLRDQNPDLAVVRAPELTAVRM
jgi:hypothetical protein